ncbi:diacylglycerol kinase family protein [Olivibacter sp. CPCC 100613]|uniref:diacylglycerol kinase family protein n=1 Tax=Olivibacter sp. CPCC 100613 TaxID=3079931 RepID=UPI002FF483D2
MGFLSALRFAWDGVRDSFKTEMNFRIHCLVALLALVLGFLLKINGNEWLWVLLSIFLVLAAELFNTALEALTNLVSPTWHPLAKKAKDAAAAAVLLVAIFSIVAGMIIFLPKLVQVIKHFDRVT